MGNRMPIVNDRSKGHDLATLFGSLLHKLHRAIDAKAKTGTFR
jgi:hypothetical protein